MGEVTELLQAVDPDNPDATERLLGLVYEELRTLAASKLAAEAPGHTLQPTALVHEAYVRLFGTTDPDWQGRRHFFGAAAEAMRRILIEHARRKRAQKRGGGLERVELLSEDLAVEHPIEDILTLDELLTRLASEHPQVAELVRLRLLAGLSNTEVAKVIGQSARSVRRNWSFARAWFLRALQDG